MSAEVRPFLAEDARAVAHLFQKVFLHTDVPPSEGLVDCFEETFCRHPWKDADLPSLVYENMDGEVRGFIGVYPVPLDFRGRRLRGAFAGNLMVDGAVQDPLAGARLLRSFLSGRQDISLTETTNAISLGMWRKLGGQVISNRSLNWVRILRPAAWVTTVGAKRVPWLAPARSLAPIIDLVAARLLPAPPNATSSHGVDVAPVELAGVAAKISRSFALHPDFDEATLSFLLQQASRKEKYGPPLARIVHNRRGQPIGGYLAHGEKNKTLRVMQIFTSPANADVVLTDLLAQAVRIGASAVNGRAQPEIFSSLTAAKCFFYGSEATAVYSRDPDLSAAVHGPDNFLNGLAGETWARLIGGAFDQSPPLPQSENFPLESLTTAKL